MILQRGLSRCAKIHGSPIRRSKTGRLSIPEKISQTRLVTAFAVSATASNWERIGKPFNPLLGETYEFDRYDDLGFRMVCEQVSHHPPISAFHVESHDFIYHGGIEPKLKFWGKSVEVTPRGVVTLYLKRHQEAFSWQYINCCVHNIIVGKIWIEHTGVMEVTNHKTKFKAVVNFKPSGWFGRDIHKLEGYLFDNNKKKIRAYYGKWTDALYGCDAKLYDNFLLNADSVADDSKITPSPGAEVRAVNGASDEQEAAAGAELVTAKLSAESDLGNGEATVSKRVTTAAEVSDLQTPSIIDAERLVKDLKINGQKLLWKANPKPDYAHMYYNFTLFAMMLNEISDQMRMKLPPSDSRIRPDIRAMENGDIDRSADEKNRLEEKQRAARKARGGDSSWKPRWFKRDRNPHTGSADWIFTNEYWTRNWSQCPNIF